MAILAVTSNSQQLMAYAACVLYRMKCLDNNNRMSIFADVDSCNSKKTNLFERQLTVVASNPIVKWNEKKAQAYTKDATHQ